MTEPDLTLPAGARLVHIGFPKTGTTSIQGAMEIAREPLRKHGVLYPGVKRYHKHAGVYLSQAKPRRGDREPLEQDWLDLLTEIEYAKPSDRVLISSEWLSETPVDGVERVVKDLGADRVHVVATLRPLTKIMPSAWQQYLQNGNRTSYENWLKGMLVKAPYDKPTPTFWARHRHDEVLARWAAIAGADNVTAIVVDSRDHNKLLRQFSSLLALPEGLLVNPPERDNRSLSWPEAEMLRSINQTIREEDWPDSIFRDIVRLGVVEKLFESVEPKQLAALPKIGMPAWAAERATEIGAEMATNIAGLGIRVVGDLESLGQLPSGDDVKRPAPMLPAPLAADAVIAAITATLDVARGEGREAQLEAFRERQTERASVARQLPPLKKLRHFAGAVRRDLLELRGVPRL
jgi:hypothetical protein